MGSKSERGLNRKDGSSGLLQTLEKSLDDIRTLITCRVCIRPLFEPYTIECGHTFCYGCLLRWFERDRTKKSCPDCRSEVLRAPAPAYLVRDMTQIFGNRAELMPPGETTEDHQKWQEEEAAAIEKDRLGTGPRGGLFRGCFRARPGHAPFVDYIRQPIIRDVEDGVDRCPRCTWELEDGICQSCGYPSEDEEWTDSDALEYVDHDDMYGDGHNLDRAVMDTFDAPPEAMDYGFGREYSPVSPSERSYSSHDEGFVDNHGVPARDQPRFAMARRQARPRTLPERGQHNVRIPHDSMQSGTDEDSEGYSEYSESESIGSLQGFLVDDAEEQPNSTSHSAGGFPSWESDASSEAEEARTHPSRISDQDYGSDEDGESEQNEVFSSPDPVAQHILDDESDEGPIPPSRRQVGRRSAISNPSSGEDSSPQTRANRRQGRMTDIPSARSGHTRTHRNGPQPKDGEPSGRSNGVPIEIDSDSDAPVSASQPSRRRRIHAPQSEEGSGAEASSGTATVGRISPISMNPRLQDSQSNSRPTNEALPIMIDSSPRQATTNDNQNHRSYNNPPSDPNRPPSLLSMLSRDRLRNGPDPPQGAPGFTNNRSRVFAPAFSPISLPSSVNGNDRRPSPVPPRSHHRSPASGSSRATTAQEEFDEGVRQRQARKAERKTDRRRKKAEREQRRGGSAVRLPSS